MRSLKERSNVRPCEGWCWKVRELENSFTASAACQSKVLKNVARRKERFPIAQATSLCPSHTFGRLGGVLGRSSPQRAGRPCWGCSSTAHPFSVATLPSFVPRSPANTEARGVTSSVVEGAAKRKDTEVLLHAYRRFAGFSRTTPDRMARIRFQDWRRHVLK